MNITYRIISGGYALPFPFNSIDAAEKHIQYLESMGSGLLHHEVQGFTLPTLDEDAALEREDREFENHAVEYYLETGKELVQI